MKLLRELSSRWSVCWATTYSFEPAFFDTVVRRRLGDPPLNATVLADAGRLARTWTALGPAEEWSIAGANRAYLLRPAHVAGGAFHAKTILLANRDEGLLLVGSGNLGIGGWERGREVFARFSSRVPEDASAFGTWRGWMGNVVAHIDEALLRSRWAALLDELVWLPTASAGSRFVTNWSRSLLDALADRVPGPVDEVLLTAPFFDADLAATRGLIDRLRPNRITIYVGEPTSVDGQMLQGLITGGVALEVLAYEPASFVHAKLVGVIGPWGGRLLSGSANASAVALLRATREGAANVEAGTIVDGDHDDIRAAFLPPGMVSHPADRTRLARLTFMPIAESPLPPVRLISVTVDARGSCTALADPLPPHAVLVGAIGPIALSAGRSGGSERVEPRPGLVWLETINGERLSNSVPLDDQAELLRALRRSEHGADRPRELEAGDLDHPLGRLLGVLHAGAVFDVDDTPASQQATRERDRDDGEPDPAFWQRLIREELANDPRVERYRRPGTDSSALYLDDVVALLDDMLHRVPAPNVLRLLGEQPPEPAGEPRSGRSWTRDERIAVRSYNVLARWSLALADPRVIWIGERAPLRHYLQLLAAMVDIWPHGWIRRDRMRVLLRTLFTAFVRGDRSSGYLMSQGPEERQAVLGALRETPAPEIAAAAIYAALADAPADEYFAWQPFLGVGLADGVILPSADAAELASALGAAGITAAKLQARLEYVATYLDDAHWSERTGRELGLVIRIATEDHPVYAVRVDIEGVTDASADPRLPQVLRAALAYRGRNGTRLRVGDAIAAVAYGLPVYLKVGAATYESPVPLTPDLLDRVIAAGDGLAGIGLVEERVAS